MLSLLLIVSLLSSSALSFYPGVLYKECENKNDWMSHEHFIRTFSDLGKYGAESMDDMIWKKLCMGFTPYFDECGGRGMNKIIDDRYPPDRQPHQVPDNKTFLQHLEFTVRSVEEQIERKLNNEYEHEYECPYWTKWDGLFLNPWGKFKRYGIINLLDYDQHQRLDEMQRRLTKNMFRTFKSLLKSLNTNDDLEKTLVREAVDTVIGSASVNVFELLELHLREHSEETKGLVKMVLTKYISSYLTADRAKCFLQELTYNKFLDDHLLSVGSDNFNIQNEAVKKIINTTSSVLEQHGTFPYIDLTHAVLDELDSLNIPDILNNQYKNYIKIRKWVKSVDWDGHFQILINATKPLEQVMRASFCANNGQFGPSEITKKIFDNIHSEILDEDLDHSIKVLFNVIPSVVRILLESWLEAKEVVIDGDKWSSPFYLTSIIKNNKGALGKLLNYEVDSSAVQSMIGNTLGDLVFVSTNIFINEGVFENISKHLLEGISLTSDEKETIIEPIQTFRKSVSCIYCDFMQKAFKTYPRQHACYPKECKSH